MIQAFLICQRALLAVGKFSKLAIGPIYLHVPIVMYDFYRHPEMFFGNGQELEVPQDTDNLLRSKEDVLEQTVPALNLDPLDLLTDSEDELSDSDEGTIESDTPDEDGSEVSSCTSTICPSEITVCAGNGSATYVPLLRSEFDSDEDQSSRSCTPTGQYYSIPR